MDSQGGKEGMKGKKKKPFNGHKNGRLSADDNVCGNIVD